MKNILFFVVALTFLPGECLANKPEPTRYPNDYLYSVHQGDPWKFFEQIFVIEPEMEIRSGRVRAQRIIGSLLGIAPGGAWFLHGAFPQLKEYYTDVFANGYKAIFTAMSRSCAMNLVLSIAAMIFGCIFVDNIIISSNKKNIFFKKFKNLVITSPNNEKLIPFEYQEFIKHVYDQYTENQYTENAANAELKKYANEAMTKILQSIYEQFPNKYRDKLETKKRFDSWIKWSIIALVAAATLKLLTSAAKDGFDISDRLNSKKKYYWGNQGTSSPPSEPEEELQQQKQPPQVQTPQQTHSGKTDDEGDELLEIYKKHNP
jgi:hypothetical protein